MNNKQRDALSFFCQVEDDVATAPHGGPGEICEVLPPGIGRLRRGKHFSVFKKEHAEEAAAVYNFLLALDSYDDFKANVEKMRPLLNEGIYLYAISVAWLHRTDTVGNLLPPSWQINPKCYFSSEAILQAKREARRRRDVTVGSRPVPLFSTGTVRDAEYKMAWWREDVMFNDHHYHWHQVYPWKGIDGKTKDRQGELFYYMHQQMLARYDAERLGVGLMRVEPYVDWSRPIKEGYNAHLTDYYGTQQFSARPANLYLADSWQDPNNPILVSQQVYHYNRLLDAVNTGQFLKSDRTTEEVTIDRLGAAVEASVSSPNIALYGSVHNIGHDLLARITDPDGRYKSADGVMGDAAVSVRDPIFFRWHKFIDNLFVLHKLNLEPYTEKDLALDDLTITSGYVKVPSSGERNVLTTRMEDFIVDISHDMFLDPDPQDSANTPVNVKVKQINHDHFEYIITMESTKAMKVAIRIFIAPSFDEHGTQLPLSSQRSLFIEMDKFVHNTHAGTNTITRSSSASSVIKPTELTYDQLQKRNTGEEEGVCTCLADRYCECGWPEHMLLPRGTPSGMQFDLFVMATDWSADSTDNLDRGTSYCGVKNKKYPDSRSMGFPFDRKLKYNTIDEFVQGFSNMYSTPVKITYTGYKTSE
ncbi:Hemocyanin AA6 chain [Holothuria leucospilota]|uniref:Hemocyanin AA6 chain n=1 Tax=Holothuria leucospilota TaxID=206669 RepID=A0A9Q0YCV6_HOLLE|nr:Hemocyanin AA6 chain [Holothuria leucospilota]